MGVVKIAVKLFVYTVLIAFGIILIPGLKPHLNYEPFSLPPPLKLEGKLGPNNILDNAEILANGQFRGPETIAIHGKEIFTGIDDGHIIRIREDGTWNKVVRLGGHGKDAFWQAPFGRPMGLRFSKSGNLYVTDAYYGLYVVDIEAGKAKQILSNKKPLSDGIPVSYLNDLDFDKDGMIYFTDTSVLSRFHNIYIEGLGDPSGRLLKFDPKSGKTEILDKKIHYANGVQMSGDEEFLAVVESIKSRVWKYFLKGPKKGTRELLIEALPGVPDNIRSNGKGGFLISLVIADTDENPSAFRLAGPYPSARKLVLRAQHLMLGFLQLWDQILPSDYWKSAQLYISHLGSLGNIMNLPRKVIIVEVDKNGNILRSLQNEDGEICFISSVEVGEQYLYFGSPYNNKLYRLDKKF